MAISDFFNVTVDILRRTKVNKELDSSFHGEWEVVASGIPAKIEPRTGVEFFDYDRIVAKQSHTLYCEPCDIEIMPDDKIEHGDNVYNIIMAKNVDLLNRYWTIYLEIQR